VLATQAPTNSGDSGGPVLNQFGEVVGFCSLSTGGVVSKSNQAVNDQLVDLAICVTEIREGLKEMRTLLASKDQPGPKEVAKTIVLKGEAHASVHHARFDKDTTYRVIVKADGFTPELRIENPDDKNPSLNPLLNYSRGIGNEINMVFTAKEQGEHRIKVGYAPGSDVNKGPLRYSLLIDQATFETDTVLKDVPLKLSEHTHTFEAAKVYDINIKGKGFEPDLQVLDGAKTVAVQFNNGLRANTSTGNKFLESVGLVDVEFETTLRFVPAKTGEYRIVVVVSPFSPAKATRNFTMRVVEAKSDLSVSDQLTIKDPLYPKGGPFKVHTVKLLANTTYQMDLLTNAFDARILLEDAAGKFVAQGFDAEGFNARLTFQPTKTDTYRIVVTSHQVDATGAYTLVVAQSRNAIVPPPPVIEKKKP
jgi:hypothetical protein